MPWSEAYRPRDDSPSFFLADSSTWVTFAEGGTPHSWKGGGVSQIFETGDSQIYFSLNKVFVHKKKEKKKEKEKKMWFLALWSIKYFK